LPVLAFAFARNLPLTGHASAIRGSVGRSRGSTDLVEASGCSFRILIDKSPRPGATTRSIRIHT
jgi:hypothetical protein